MKNSLLALSAVFALFMTSCSSDDNASDDDALMGSGEISIKYDNGFNGNDLVLGTANAANANGEAITINRFNYIVSNFRLVNAAGEEFTYAKDDSYFIINQETEDDQIALADIPTGEYTTLKFGVGIDQEKYLQGAEGQGDFLTLAEDNNMMWSWQAGYKFLNFEGTFTSETITEATEFKIHMGSHGSSLDNYKEVTLELPNNVVVGDGVDSNIHLKIDASKILVGDTNSIELTEKQVIMVDAEKSPQIAVNTSEMFVVDHVHNGDGH
ncbi:MbnP family protein [Zobellia laminariae]|uniref:MbnP family protein n=1 Tax=Zobellia laminariae TaxID=248906 RepID=UPI003EF6AFCB